MPKKLKNSSSKELKIPTLGQKKLRLSPEKIKEVVLKTEKEIIQDQSIKNEEAPILVPKNVEAITLPDVQVSSLENLIAQTPAPPTNNQNMTTLLSPYALNTKQPSDNYAFSSGYNTLTDNYGMSIEKNEQFGNPSEEKKSEIPFSHDIDDSLQQNYMPKSSRRKTGMS